jgi:hypothetical protein
MKTDTFLLKSFICWTQALEKITLIVRDTTPFKVQDFPEILMGTSHSPLFANHGCLAQSGVVEEGEYLPWTVTTFS